MDREEARGALWDPVVRDEAYRDPVDAVAGDAVVVACGLCFPS